MKELTIEFTRLADVDIVETVNDTDKVLIEQDGEIKRVAKTKVGGAGGNGLVIITEDMRSLTANMTLTEALEALNKHELSYGVVCATLQGMPISMTIMAMMNGTALLGSETMMMLMASPEGNMELYWTTDGLTTEPPM